MKEIILTGGHITLVDDEDYECLKDFKWTLMRQQNVKSQYAQCKIHGRVQLMHRIITSAPRGSVVDHINGNGLDNRKNNLRVCSQADNCRNQKLSHNNKFGYKGVQKKNSKYTASIRVNRQLIHLGIFNTPQEAADAYDCAAVEHFGEFALTNKQIRAARQSGSKKG